MGIGKCRGSIVFINQYLLSDRTKITQANTIVTCALLVGTHGLKEKLHRYVLQIIATVAASDIQQNNE